MKHHMGWLIALSACAALAGGCGGATAGEDTTAAQVEEVRWTSAQLQKLAPELRTRVRSGEQGRIAVRVFFLELPSDAELASMLLNRLGDQAIGQVEEETLHRIASRTDVERIEEITDTGYEAP